MNQLIKVVAIVLFTAVALSALGGCSVNVVYLDGVNFDASVNPANYIEAPLPDVAVFDCQFAPAADECQ
jgi:hypothetical protein